MISALVPTLGGAERLHRNLPSVFESLAASGEEHEVLVACDGEGVGAIDPRARVLALAGPRGYGPTVNAAARAARGDYLLILNDDIRLERPTVAGLRAHFPNPGLFAVVPAIRSPLARCGDEGGKAGRFRAGLLELEERVDSAPSPTLYPVGCCLLCPRGLFLELGGYDDAYAPFLWEDVDLGYRAWRRGLSILHDPRSACDHEGSATLRERHDLDTRERLWHRNRVLFHLKNVRDERRRAELLGTLAATALFENRRPRREGVAEALRVAIDPPAADGLDDAEIVDRSSR